MKKYGLQKIISLFLAILCVLQVFALPVSAAGNTTTKTQYRYHRYSDDKGKFSLCPYYGNWRHSTTLYLEYTPWLDEPLQIESTNFRHVYQGSACDKAGCIDPSRDTNRYVDENGNLWYYEETRTIEVVIETEPEPQPEPQPQPEPEPAPQPQPQPEPEPEPEPEPAPQPQPQPETKPEPQPVPETEPVPETKPEPEKNEDKPLIDLPPAADSVWNEIGVGILDYGVELLEVALDTFTPSDELEFIASLLDYKETIKNLLTVTFVGKIEDPNHAKKLMEIIDNALDEVSDPTDSTNELTDEVLEIAKSLILEALEDQPELWAEVIQTAITKSPKLALYCLKELGGESFKAYELLIGVWEVSADKFWALGEALAECRSVFGDAVEAEIFYSEQLIDGHHQLMLTTAKEAIKDNATNSFENLERFQTVTETIEGMRKKQLDYIDSKLTFWYRLLHPVKTKHLEKVRDEVENLEIDYEAYYWEIRNGLK